MKILVVVPYVPSRIRTRPFHLIKTLAAQGHRITLATVWSHPQDLCEIEEMKEGVHELLCERVRAGRSIWNCVRAIPGFRPMQASYSWSPRLARRTAQLLETADFDVVHVEHLRGVRYGLALMQALRKRGRRRPAMVWDSVDCISSLFNKAARSSCTFRSRLAARIELSRTARYEGWLAAQFDRVLATSEIDRHELMNLAGRLAPQTTAARAGTLAERLVVVPNGVDLQYFSPPSEARTPLTLVISGKMSYHANVAAVVYFAREVMPTVWGTHPGTQLWVVGKDPPAEVKRLGVPWSQDRPAAALGGGDSRIRITGTVADIRPFLRRASVAVAPIQYGAGIQNKVLEALACGTPVVATPEAVSGLRVRWGEDLMVAKDGREFARSVLQVLTDAPQGARLGRAGRRFVERDHDWFSISENLARTYRDATS